VLHFEAQKLVSARSLSDSHISVLGARMKDVFTLQTIFAAKLCRLLRLLRSREDEARREETSLTKETIFSKGSGSLEEATQINQTTFCPSSSLHSSSYAPSEQLVL
jgi:hypothetical protein